MRSARFAVGALRRRRWARPREVEAIVGRFTHAFLLHRPAFSVFSAVYAFAEKVVSIVFGRLWVSSMFRCILHLPHTSADSYDFASLPTIIECFISAFLSREFFQHKRFSAGLQTPFRLKGTDLLSEHACFVCSVGSKC